MGEGPSLQRVLGTFTLTLYGVGVIVGAGIFVLVGEVVAVAGPASWLAFVGASAAALPTGLSYAALASRYPRSGGEAVFASKAFARPAVTFLVGFAVVASGVTSTAAVSHGFADYLRVFVSEGTLPRWVVIVGFLAVLSLVNGRGIRGSTWLNATFTTLSVLALLVLALAGVPSWGDNWRPLLRASYEVPPLAILSAVALAFYSFVGFEDICNVAEETRRPSSTIPKAILLSLGGATILYALVTFTALSTVPADELAQSSAPMVLVSAQVLPAASSHWLAAVALLAVSNTALFNLIMTSRVLYGMAREGSVPGVFGRVGSRTHTPLISVGLAFGLAVALALTGILRVLAEATNVIILLAFTAVNLSFIVVRWRKIPPEAGIDSTFDVPAFVPWIGIVFTVVLLTNLSAGAYARAAGLAVVGVVLHLLVRRSSKSKEGPGGNEDDSGVGESGPQG